MSYTYKSVATKAKDVDVKSRTITGYASTFGFKDSDGDVIMPGAYKKSLAERSAAGKNRILHLYQHDPTQVLSRPYLLKEDNIGLYFETTLPETRLANDVLKLYEAGIIEEHSVGFNVIRKEQKQGYTELHELKLWEFSSVSWGANEQSIFTGFKSMNKNTMDKKFKAIVTMLKNGDMSDEGFAALEIYFAQLKQIMGDVEQPEDNTTADQPSNDTEAESKNLELINLINEFKNKFN